MIHLLGMGSPNVVKVMIMLEETGLPWRFSQIDVFGGEQFTPAFTALNPNSKTPVIVDEMDPAAPVTVAESGAILIHLAEKAGKFLPQAPAARAAVLQWLMFQMSGLGPIAGQAIHFRFVNNEDGYGRRRFITELRRLIGVIEAQLDVQAHIAGPDYSIADIAIFPWLRTLGNFFPEMLQGASLQRWWGQVAERPAVAKALAFAGEVSTEDRAARRAASPEALDRYFGRAPSPAA